MKRVQELNLGFNDAENYKRRENKKLFSEIFVKNKYLDELLKPSTYFLIGEKGTGKTAYSVYLSNNVYTDKISGINFVSQIRYIRETDYQKFIALKTQKHLQLSDYTSIWKVIIMLLFAKSIKKEEIDAMPFNKGMKMKVVINAIDEYYANAFSPEIISALEFIENDLKAAQLMSKHINIGTEVKTQTSRQESRFQINLMYIQQQFEKALSDLKLKQNHLIFIDGLDIRPGLIPYSDYLECVKGLANAIWSLNSDFFADIKDSKGRFRAICLIRPDIFNSLNLQNSTNKVRDNSVFLDWRTTYPDHRKSELFKLTDRLLGAQQIDCDLSLGEIWDFYFPFSFDSRSPERDVEPAFVEFLRLTYSRPRDMVTLLQIMQRQMIDSGNGDADTFNKMSFLSSSFQSDYSEYLMSSIKDQLAFYYSETDYDLFLNFFSYLKGRIDFNYDQYAQAYNEYQEYICKNLKDSIPEFVENQDKFLQFLYDTNIICYIEETNGLPLIRWCYRERSMSNINPKVRLNMSYRIHYGLAKALNVGNLKIK